jgi:cytochrome c oxidase subunit 4
MKSTPTNRTAAMHAEERRVWVTWIALLLLAGLTFALSFVPTHLFAVPVAMLIATVKATLVALFFMELVGSGTTPRLAFALALLLFVILLALLATDVVTRPIPALVPQGAPQ